MRFDGEERMLKRDSTVMKFVGREAKIKFWCWLKMFNDVCGLKYWKVIE